MTAFRQHEFDSNRADAAARVAVASRSAIRTRMNRADWAIMLLLAVVWGSAFLFISIAVHQMPPLTYVWLRLSIAAAGLWAFLWWRGERAGLPRQVWGAMLILAVLNNVIPFALIGWGEVRISSGLASILNATTPIWGVLVAHVFTRDERMSPGKTIGVLLGFAGVVAMIGPSLLSSLGSSSLAELACVIASLSYALAAVWARRFKAMGLDPVTVTNGQLTMGALVMLPLALLVDTPWLQPAPSSGAIAAVFALALLCTAFAYILYFRLIDRAGATNALLVTLLVPPIAVLLGILFLGETLAAQDVAGLALIALGLAAIDGRVTSMLRRPRRPPQAA